ncbi:endonuclease V [Risungbinella massiliensis]|uniref:endonuclease V n=1 Tax=Risungbinella massiliensis TaxID=1329796 RepID=UPI0005CBECBB|nr:endonuclease V [Risungbinella massiliensis]
MHIEMRHSFDLNEYEQQELQSQLRQEIRIPDQFSLTPKVVAGIDLAYWDNQAIAIVLAMDYETKEVLEVVHHQATVSQDYIPGLLAFRELPVLLPAWEKLQTTPDLVFLDGNGILHPRRMGLATHASFFFGLPTIGVAKTSFAREYPEPELAAGSIQYIQDGAETLGAVVRTQTRVKPVFVSVGNRINLESAVRFALHFVGKHSRIPEITRQPDIWSRKLRKQHQ